MKGETGEARGKPVGVHVLLIGGTLGEDGCTGLDRMGGP